MLQRIGIDKWERVHLLAQKETGTDWVGLPENESVLSGRICAAFDLRDHGRRAPNIRIAHDPRTKRRVDDALVQERAPARQLTG